MVRKISKMPGMCVGASVLALTMGGLFATAQSIAPAAPRVVGSVAGSAYVPLKSAVPLLARPQFDRGEVPASSGTGKLLLVLQRSPEQQKSLDALLAAQQNPHSPSYHQWLTPESFGKQFGVADADLQSVTSFLSAQGFSVDRVFPGKVAVEFSGTAGQVKSAFRTSIHSYAAGGQVFRANSAAPQIPGALAPVVAGIAGLSDYRPAANNRLGHMVLDPRTGHAKPQFTDVINDDVAVTPGDLTKLYDVPSAYDGTGVTIGVIGTSNINVTYAANYRTTFGLPAGTPNVIVDGDDPGITADTFTGLAEIELIAAVAPKAQVNYYITGSVGTDTTLNPNQEVALIRAIEDNAVQVLQFGFDTCEASLTSSDNSLFDQAWQQAAAQGITVLTSSGNGGAADCDAPVGTVPEATATKGLAVNGFASSPYATAVGATDFSYPQGSINPDIDFTANAIIQKYWPGTGYASAAGYVPEQPWNTSNPAQNAISNPSPLILTTGGGVSTLGLVDPNTGAESPQPQPYWQLPVASAISTTARVLPDVSVFGGSGYNGSFYAVCLEAIDCVNGTPSTLTTSAAGNTFSSSAVFAGMAALIVQSQRGVSQGNINPTLYSLAQTAGANAFHRATGGTNAVSCASGSPNCTNGFTSTANGSPAYPATATVYDAAVGLGSVDLGNLIKAWKNPNSTPVGSITFSITTPGTTTPVTQTQYNSPVQFNATVTGGSGAAPTGGVVIYTTSPLPSNGVQLLLPLSGGSAAGVWPNLPGGTYQVYARYSGDATYAPQLSAPVTITVTPLASAVSIIGQNIPNNSTTSYGTPVIINVEPFPTPPPTGGATGSPTGSIQVRDNAGGGLLTILPLNAVGEGIFTSANLAVGAHALTFTYTGDASLAPSLPSAPISFTVQPLATSTSLVISDPKVISSNSTVDLIATVTPTGSNKGMSPSGSVYWKLSTGKVLASAPLQPVLDANGNSISTASLTRTGYAFNLGLNSVTAYYVPDASGNFTASNSAAQTFNNLASPNINPTTVTLSTTPSVTQIFNYSALTLNATVTAANGTAVGGLVTFFANGASLGSAQVKNGAASLSAPVDPNTANLLLPLGVDTITAQYSGDLQHGASTDTYTLTVLSDTTAPDFSIQSNQAYGTLSSSSPSANFTLQFTSLNNFVSKGVPITLSYTLPAGINCTAAPTAPNFNGTNYATVGLTCQASGTSAQLMAAPTHTQRRWWYAGGGTALACVFLFGLPTRRRHWQSLLGVLAVLVFTASLTACGADLKNYGGVDAPKSPSSSASSGASTTTGSAALTPGRYTVVVIATAQVFTGNVPNSSTAVSHTLPLTIVVQ